MTEPTGAPAETTTETEKEDVTVEPTPGTEAAVNAPAEEKPADAPADTDKESDKATDKLSPSASALKRLSESGTQNDSANVLSEDHDTSQQRTTLASVPMPITVEDPQGIERIVQAAPDGWEHPSLDPDPKEVARQEEIKAALEAKKAERLAILEGRD